MDAVQDSTIPNQVYKEKVIVAKKVKAVTVIQRIEEKAHDAELQKASFG